MPKPSSRDEQDEHPAAMPIPQTDHHAGEGAGAAPLHTIESTGTTGGVRSRPRPRAEDSDAGGLTTLQVVAAVSLGAVLAAGIAAAVVAALGEDDEEDEPAAKPRPKRRTGVAAAKKRAASVPRKKSTARPVRAPATEKRRVDLNEADGDELARLPGVGPATATAILARRPFHSVDELESVPGIGSASLRKLRTRVKV